MAFEKYSISILPYGVQISNFRPIREQVIWQGVLLLEIFYFPSLQFSLVIDSSVFK